MSPGEITPSGQVIWAAAAASVWPEQSQDTQAILPVESIRTWPFLSVESGSSSVPVSKMLLLPLGLAVAVQR